MTTRWHVEGRWDTVAVEALFARTRPDAGQIADLFPVSLGQSELPVLEDRCSVRFPGAFRKFLVEVGDRTPGPGGRLLSVISGADGRERRSLELTHANDPFERSPGDAFAPRGSITLMTDEEGASRTVLVMTGPDGGSVWEGADPPINFATWYSQYLESLVTSGRVLPLPDRDGAALEQELAAMWMATGAGDADSAVDLALGLLADGRPVGVAAALRCLVLTDPVMASGAARQIGPDIGNHESNGEEEEEEEEEEDDDLG